MKRFVHFTNKSKCVKSLDTREQLIQFVDLIAGARIRNAAALKSDELTLSITSHDIVAADAHYHARCCKGYVKVAYYRPGIEMPNKLIITTKK